MNKKNAVLTTKFNKILVLIGLSGMIAILPAIKNAEAAAGKPAKVVFAVE
ncbi:MAG: hypothetical protein ACHQIM_19785 [Sphingobacteriales bacterium]